jgi:predicted DsbA family dithiol-disulfide isomerase
MIETAGWHSVNRAGTVLHWYDFVCPFCYVAQQRNEIFLRHGISVVALPFQAHPDIPPGGISAGDRNGPMYAMLEDEARKMGLPLQWPRHLPNTRRALAAVEWTHREQPGAFPHVARDLFEAHFALGEDLEDQRVIDRHAGRWDVDLPALHAALADGTAAAAVTAAERLGRSHGVRGTPAWLVGQQLVTGLQPTVAFDRLARYSLATRP